MSTSKFVILIGLCAGVIFCESASNSDHELNKIANKSLNVLSETVRFNFNVPESMNFTKKSPVFDLNGVKWNLKVETNISYSVEIDLYLEPANPHEIIEYKTRVVFRLLHPHDSETNSRNISREGKTIRNHTVGCLGFIDLFNFNRIYVINGSATLEAEVTVVPTGTSAPKGDSLKVIETKFLFTVNNTKMLNGYNVKSPVFNLQDIKWTVNCRSIRKPFPQFDDDLRRQFIVDLKADINDMDNHSSWDVTASFELLDLKGHWNPQKRSIIALFNKRRSTEFIEYLIDERYATDGELTISIDIKVDDPRSSGTNNLY